MVTPQVDAAILKTIARIRAKDPSVYNADRPFFTDDIFEAKAKGSKNKPVRLADHHRTMLLNGSEEQTEDHTPYTYNDEQRQLKSEVKKAFLGSDDEEEDEDDLLVVRDKTRTEKDDEEEEYRDFLRKQIGDDELKLALQEDGADKADIHDVDEQFLSEYILNRGWKDPKHVPDYDELTRQHHDDVDEEFEEKADAFESAYNFRFEDPEAAQITTHSRDVEASVRRKDDSRKRKRQSVSERKELEQKQKMEELKRLKNLKKREILDKLRKIQDITGAEVEGFEDLDIDGDFDPDAYDQKMANIYSQEYYTEADKKKPVFEDDIDIGDIYEAEPKGKKLKKAKKGHVEEDEDDEDLDMDADHLPGGQVYVKEETGKRKKELDRALEDMYALDYEDMIDDLPTRFKYTKVEADTYGLSPAEILLADDKDLNEYLGLRKLAPYRNSESQQLDRKKYASKRQRVKEFKKKLWTAVENKEIEVEGKGWKRKKGPRSDDKDKSNGKKKSNGVMDKAATLNDAEDLTTNVEEPVSDRKKKRRKKKKIAKVVA